MGHEEIAAARRLELEQLAEQEIAETLREGRRARERIDAAAAALAAPLGLPGSAGEPVAEPVSEERPSAADFADIADRILAND